MNGQLASWGRFPKVLQTSQSPHWSADVAPMLADAVARDNTLLPWGNGRSYGDSCLANSTELLEMRTLNRWISVDWESGIIRAEAGITLADVLRFAIPRGWFLPVTPGTKFVTLGGAVANDVHGKNHHTAGTFGNHVLSFGLVRSDRGSVTCSPQQETDLFAATVGGLGLSGVITWVELALQPIQSALIDTVTIPFASLGEFFDLSAELDASHEYTVAWIDCLAGGDKLGQGVFFAGNHAIEGPLEVGRRRGLGFPLTPPVSLVNKLSLRMFNAAYIKSHGQQRSNQQTDWDRFFYPLDAIADWNRMYGRKGFQQFQCVVPEATAADACGEMLAVIADSGTGSFLAVLKQFGGRCSPGLLSFPLAGASLALDFPNNERAITPLFRRLDDIVEQAGGRLYPAKDAHMSAAMFQSSYPNWEKVEAQRDPAIMSRFWNRVTPANSGASNER